jgi:hypothetical protein
MMFSMSKLALYRYSQNTSLPSIHEIQALSDLISGSAVSSLLFINLVQSSRMLSIQVQRERLELAMLQASIDVTSDQTAPLEAVQKLTSVSAQDRLEASKVVQPTEDFLRVVDALSAPPRSPSEQIAEHAETASTSGNVYS